MLDAGLKKKTKKTKKIFYDWFGRPERTYIVLAIIGAFGFAIITPPFQGPDEEAHYVRAQYIANGYLVPENVNRSDASLPKSIEQVTGITFYEDDIRGRTNFTYELHRTKEALKVPYDVSGSYKPQMVNYSPLPYLPAVPGIVVANVFNLSPIISMYVARILLALGSITLVYLAIRIIPDKKYLLAAVALIPMMVFQQSVVSVDGITYALLVLFLAYVLHLRKLNVVTKQQWVTIGILCVAITLAKPLVFIFLPVIALLLRSKYDFRWIAGIAIICAVALLGWTAIMSSKTAGMVMSAPENVDSTQQGALLKGDPKRGLRVMWNSYMTPYGDDETRGVIGVFGAADTAYPLWMGMIYGAVLGILAIVQLGKRRLGEFHYGWKIFALLLCFIYFVSVNLALYLTYTPVNFDIVYGVQGRYFLPVILVISTVVLTGGITLSLKDARKVKIWSLMTIAILILLALFTTYQRYYLYTP